MSYKLDKAKILLVDDMAPMLSLMFSILTIFGFKQIYKAHSGDEGFELVCKHDPDLIVTDWVMHPDDGLEFTRNIRRNPLSPNPYVPVLMMTGFSSKVRVEQARDAGVTEFLVKPFKAKDLCVRIAQIIEKPRQFVDAEDFFGPDRRRRTDQGFDGSRKRDDDPTPVDPADILGKLREEAKDIKKD